jgi:predicted metal-binding transcription factor (methanogenesis marker protein 9)
MAELKVELAQSKVVEYQHSCLKRSEHEKKIQGSKEEHLQVKKKKRDEVINQEEQSRNHILEYINRKNKTIHEGIVAERNEYVQKKLRKESEIKKVSELEMKMIKKHSESQVAYLEMKDKLDEMLGQIRKESRESKSKMMSVACAKSSEGAFYPNSL